MFKCKFSMCEHMSGTVVQFIQHTKLHSNTPHYHYQCGVPDCARTYQKASVLTTHMYREHGRPGPSLQHRRPFDTPLKCVALSCAFKCDTLTSLLSHLKSHIKEGLETKCPFRGCDHSYTVASSFASHVSRKHTTRCVEDLDDLVFDRSVPTEPLNQHEASQSCSDISDENHESEMPFAVDETLFLQNLTLLYLKLQAKLLLPASTIQTIIEDFQNAHEIGLSHSLNILNEKLKVLGISEATVSNIIDEINGGDLLRLYNRGVLSTDIKRKGAFKKNFNYVEPVPLFLGVDENGKECFAQYVSLLETLTTLFKSKSVQEQYVSILNKLREALNNKGSTVIGYCKDLQRHPGIEDVLSSYDPETSDKAACILLLLMAYFKEPKNAIMLETDPCSTAADVQRTLTLPSTPCLIVQGDMMKPSAWMLSIEGEVVMGPHDSFINGIAAVFASYYNFNLQYPDDNSHTLEFIQRYFLGINPETGSKSWKKRINQHVSTLVRKLIDFDWMVM